MTTSRLTPSPTRFGMRLLLSFAACAAVLMPSGCSDTREPQKYAVYSFNQSGQFGSLDVTKGKFTRIGPDMPEGATGLALSSNGSLLTLGYSGMLYSIQPITGVATEVGPTGLIDCIGPPSSPCGPTAADNIALLGSTLFVNDMGTNLYAIDPSTGKATLVGPTGIPAALPTVDTMNPDGSFNFFDFTLFSANGKLYATSDSTVTNFATGSSVATVPAYLYEIDPHTGRATRIAPTTPNLTAAFSIGGVAYAYYGFQSEWVTLSLTDGTIKKVSDDADPSVGPTFGAYAVPVP